MRDDEVRGLLQAHWERHANAGDFEEAHAIYHEDAVLEWPQSRERVRGQRDVSSDARRCATPPFQNVEDHGGGDHWIVENLMSVVGGDPQLTVSFLEWRGDKVAREVVYITQPSRLPVSGRGGRSGSRYRPW
jgi:hypothetical protein